MKSAFQALHDRLDLAGVMASGIERSDLLPGRPEDKVAGNLGKRFSEEILRAIERGRYDPSPAYFVPVPKSSHATRPAALLNLADRAVYAALVSEFRPRIEEALLGNGIVFWPRGFPARTNWREFEHSPLAKKLDYIVVADVSAFYESIDHELLAERLVRMTGLREHAEALHEFLDRVMRSRRGIPQGLPASDHLATAYISPVDYEMIREGFNYSRHGDDIRMAAENYGGARHALLALEQSVRAAGLQLNGVKSKILKSETYGEKLQSIEDLFAATKRALHSSRVDKLKSDSSALIDTLKQTNNEELAWDLFYHGSVTLTEVIEKIASTLEPDDRQIAESLFAATIARGPGTDDPLEADAFHQQLIASLVRLAATRSPSALPYISALLRSFPEKTGQLCSYLSALAEEYPSEVCEQLVTVLEAKAYRTEWESATMVRTLARVHDRISSTIEVMLRQVVIQPRGAFLFAIEAAKLLALRGSLSQENLSGLWHTAPKSFRTDLVIAAESLATRCSWADAFLKGSIDDPILKAVAAQLAEQRTTEFAPPKTKTPPERETVDLGPTAEPPADRPRQPPLKRPPSSST